MYVVAQVVGAILCWIGVACAIAVCDGDKCFVHGFVKNYGQWRVPCIVNRNDVVGLRLKTIVENVTILVGNKRHYIVACIEINLRQRIACVALDCKGVVRR